MSAADPVKIEDSEYISSGFSLKSSPLDSIFKTTIHLINDNIEHFKDDETEPGQRLHSGFRALQDALLAVPEHIEQIKERLCSYDFSPEIPGSGYRSFYNLTQQATLRVFELCKQISTSRDSILMFRKGHYVKEVEAWGQAMAAISTVLEFLVIALLPRTENGNLLPEIDASPMELITLLNSVSQYSFYGRCMGFQFHESLWKVLKFLNISMCAFSEGYYSDGSFMQKTKHSLITGGKYVMDPEQRSRRIVDVIQYANIDFVKAFWSLADTELLAQLPSIVGPSLAVEQTVIVPCEVMEILTIDEKLISVEAPHSHVPPSPITCFLLSSSHREGMPGDRQVKSSLLPPTPQIIFHCHGGGFVSQSTRAQQVFLRQWAATLDAPIFSADYALAPEAKYPRGFEEVFTAYVWMLNNFKLLGTTGEKIVLTGDSAGGNLIMAITIKCIELGIRPPDGLLLAYTPFVIKVMASPSRILGIMDPMLPIGFALRCLKAYAGASSNRTSLVNSPDDDSHSLSSNVNVDGDSAVSSEEPVIDKQFEKNTKSFDPSTSDSESFVDVSQSDAKQTTTATTTTTSTAAGVADTINKRHSFGSETDTMTTVSLASDSTAKTEEAPRGVLSHGGGDGHPEISEMPETKEEKSRKYVTDFLQKYVLGSRLDKEGKQVPILRTGSEDIDDENVVYETPEAPLGIGAKFGKAKEAMMGGISAGWSYLKKDKSTDVPPSTSEEPGEGNKKPLLGTSLLRRQSSCTLLEDFFGIEIEQDCYISPYTASDDILAKFPPCSIMTTQYDFCLDDSVMMAKKFRSLGVPVTLDVTDGLPHGFLNLCLVSKEAQDGCKIAVSRIKKLLGKDQDTVG